MIDQSAAMGNGNGGSCYPATGTVTATAANQNVVTLDASGLLCEVGAAPAPLTLSGSYIVDTSSSTDRFSNSTGVRSMQVGIDVSDNAYMNLSGAMGKDGGSGPMGSGSGGGGGMGGGGLH